MATPRLAQRVQMKMKDLTAGAALILLLGASAATASSVSITETFDISNLGSICTISDCYLQPTGASVPGHGFDLAVGDTLDHRINFTNNQGITLTNPSMLWLLTYATTNSDVTGVGSLSLLDVHGNAFLTSNVLTDTESAVHFGQFFYATNFSSPLPSSLTFFGLEYVGTVISYGSGETTREYTSSALVMSADQFSLAAAPEPASWTLMMLGVGGMGAALRTRRRKAVAA